MRFEILIIFIINGFVGIGYSLIATLFPILGKQINLSESLLGWIISIYSLSNFLITPFIPNLISKIGKRKSFKYSLIISSLSLISYSFFKFIYSFYIFIFLSFLIRIIHGMASSIVGNLVLSLLISLSTPEELTTNVGYNDIVWSLGFSIGPIISSFLYHFFGFCIPFFFIGLIFYIPIYYIQYLNINNDNANNIDNKNIKFFSFFNLEMIINFIPAIIFQISNSYFFPSLIYHLNSKWNLNIEKSSLFFMLTIIGYFITLQFLNKILQNCGLELTILLGQILIFIGAPFVYPIKILPQTIISIIIGLFLLGASGSLICVPVIMQYGTIISKINNLLNDSTINDIASAIFNIAINSGDFIGPVFGGFVSTKYGFFYSNVYMSIIGLISSFLFFCYYSRNIMEVIKDIFNNGFNKIRYYENKNQLETLN